MDFNIVDLILIVCFIPAIVEGLRKGLVNQLAELISIIAGIWAAFKCSSALAELLSPTLKNADPVMIKVLSFIVLIVVVFLLARVIGRIVTSILKAVTLGWLNRLAGLIFSLLKATLILGLILLIFDGLNTRLEIVDRSILRDSKIYCDIHLVCGKVFPFLKSFISKS